MRKPSMTVAAAAILFLIGCGGDTTGPARPIGATMSARIDGAVWSAMSITTDSGPPSLIVVRGTNGSQTLAIGIPVDPGPGTQVVGSTTPVFAVLVNGSQSWAASRTQGGAGSITLSTVAPGHIAGRFEFTMAGHQAGSPAERRVSSGTFDVKY